MKGHTSQTTDAGAVSRALNSSNLGIVEKSELDRLVSEVQKKPGTTIRDKIPQKRPRCFQSDKVVKLYGKYMGPLTKNERNGEGLFMW